jgi:hypothetical protein
MVTERRRRNGLRLKTEMLSWDDGPEWERWKIGFERKIGVENV